MRINEIGGLLESPQSINASEFGFNQSKVNQGQAEKLLADKRCKPVGQINGNTLYKIGNKYALIDTNNKQIDYYVQYENKWVTLLKTNAIQQVMVWARKGQQGRGIAQDIFFNYLLPETGCMITDSFQTPDGERFWGNMVANALQTNLNVYYIDIMPFNLTIKKINNMDEFESLRSEIWGDQQRKQEKRVIITNKTFNERS
jgi:hypothetical protein